MIHCCSQCNFTAQFESALLMHHQLHHEPAVGDYSDASKQPLKDKFNTLPRAALDTSFSSAKEHRGPKGLGRTSSATRLFDKLRARICRSKTLFSHAEETADTTLNVNDLAVPSECTSKALKVDSCISRTSAITALREERKETYGCHLCSFEADRITVLDRHLLNDHKIGLESLLKLVMAKTKDGLSEDNANIEFYGIKQPYYKPQDEIIEDGEFVIETVTPKIKILKHTATNTDLQWSDIPNLKDNYRMISRELEKFIKHPIENVNNEDFLVKMQTLNEWMCKFVDSSNTLKKVLNKEFDSKHVREHGADEPYFELGLGDQEKTPRDWEKAHSEKMERCRSRHGDKCRGEKSKLSSESFYF